MITDQELTEILSNMKQAIDLMVLKIESLEKRVQVTEEAVQKVETEFIKNIYEPAQKAFDEAVDAENFRLFQEKYGERLAPYAESLKSIEGEDFDIARHAYDEYKALEDKTITSDDYIEKLIPSIEAQLNKIRETLGASEVEVKVDANGETEVKVDGEEAKPAEAPTAEEVKEAIASVPEGKVEELAEAALDDPEEIAAFERELAASLKK